MGRFLTFLVLLACATLAIVVFRDNFVGFAARHRTLRRLTPRTPANAMLHNRVRLPSISFPLLDRKCVSRDTSLTIDCANLLDSIERNVRVGGSLRASVLTAHEQLPPGRLRDALDYLVVHCRTGAPLEDVLKHRTDRDIHADISFTIQSVVAASAGGPGTVHALHRAAWVLRERHIVREERRVHAAQAILSAKVMSWMPLGFGCVMLLTSNHVRNAVFGTPVGFICLVIGSALNLAGRRWMTRITGVVA
jgi:Flp pilus assembly protein TadB